MSNTEPKFNYGEALQKSNLFYLAQRSGDLPEDYALKWRGDSAVNDGSDVGRDLSGGYYDAGDHVKFGLPGAASMTMLSWGVSEYREGYKKVGQLDETLDNIKWGVDYILKAYDDKGTKTTRDDVFWSQVGDGNLDHAYWGSPEDMKMARPAFKVDAQNPGSDVAAESAAALASASIVFRSTNKAYADKLLQKAQQLYDFADKYQGAYSDSIPNAQPFYRSWSGYRDELAWGATWVHKAIKAAGRNDTKYLGKAENYYGGIGWTHDWDNKSAGTGILLAQETGKNRYKRDVESFLDNWAKPDGSVQKTDGGLAWLTEWASLRYSANTAFLAGVYGDTVNDKGGLYSEFSEKQINYILGDNPRNFSYMVGFGDRSPQNPHHRAASGTTNLYNSESNKHTLYGALVGGPTKPNDYAYQDKRDDFVSNEVALDYNAGLTGALARMTKEFGGKALDKIPGVNLKGGGGSNNVNPASPSAPPKNEEKEQNPPELVSPVAPKVDEKPNKPIGDTNPDIANNPVKPVDNINPDLGQKPNKPVDNINPDPVNSIQEDVNLSVLHEWGDGFIGKVEITNSGTKTIKGWELGFDAPFEIQELWNGNIEIGAGDKNSVTNAHWNGLIAPSESQWFGFKATKSNNMDLAISGIELNKVQTI